MAMHRAGRLSAPDARSAGRVGGCALPRASPAAAAPVARRAERRAASLIVRSTPPDVPKEDRAGGREWLDTFLARFGPVRDKAMQPTTLDFEKPLLELDKRIKEARPARPAAARAAPLEARIAGAAVRCAPPPPPRPRPRPKPSR